MSVQISLPDELAARIDEVAPDRTVFVTDAVRRLLHKSPPPADETARINELADELNREAQEVLAYEVPR